jgi:hypothetical protein
VPASRSNTCAALFSPTKRSASGRRARASSSATRRRSQSGTPGSGTALSRAGTPAFLKYFWVRTSTATWDHAVGASSRSSRNTTEPSGLRISLLVTRKGTVA